jgi:hypothetical protein
MTYAESFDVSYMVYINMFVNIMEETSSEKEGSTDIE